MSCAANYHSTLVQHFKGQEMHNLKQGNYNLFLIIFNYFNLFWNVSVTVGLILVYYHFTGRIKPRKHCSCEMHGLNTGVCLKQAKVTDTPLFCPIF